ncbi:MAG: bifunctional riboflavin kinase/FAD synthetase [Candidatus Binatia bacterium]
MQIIRHIEDRNLSISKPILTMGNFDGIHLGHQSLLQRVVQDARAQDGRSVVLTFEPHPLKVLAPQYAPRLILTHKDKMQLLESSGVDVVVIQAFNSDFANIEAEEFVRRYLIDWLKVHKVWVGRGFGFGKGRKGQLEDLIRWGTEGRFKVEILDPIQLGGERVSSSQIRKLIEQGDMKETSRFLGRYHFVSGRVVPGHKRGRQLGFPTANIVTRTEVLPRDGIYATLLQEGDNEWPSVTSIGFNPTFGNGSRTTESYIFDFHGDLYEKKVRLFFIKRIREEKKFSSEDLLVEQMNKDVLSAQDILSEVRRGEAMGLTK